jgi:hypothetical protein
MLMTPVPKGKIDMKTLPELETPTPHELNRAELDAVSGGAGCGFDPPPETNREYVIRAAGYWPLDGVPLKQS